MHYTARKDQLVDRKIEEDLKYIVEHVRKLLGNHIHAILLTGGFGRGEGSVVIEKNGEIKIVNDYDISIVLREKDILEYTLIYRKYHSRLLALAQRLARELKMKQVDLDMKHMSYFSDRNHPKIENYEVLKGHVLLYGKDDPCDLMPDYRPSDIPVFEGTRLFRNRGAGLLIAAKYFVGSGRIPEEKRENFVIECTKAVLAMGDSILLLKKRYHHLYRKRLEIIQELNLDDIPLSEWIVPAYVEALEHKLQPDFEKFYRRNMIRWWFEIVSLFDKFYRYFETKRLGLPFQDWLEYSELPKPENHLEIRKFIAGLLRGGMAGLSPMALRRNLLQAKKSGFISLMALLLFSVENDGFNELYLERAAEQLGVRLGNHSRDNWRRLTDVFFQTWHPAGEAGQVIGM